MNRVLQLLLTLIALPLLMGADTYWRWVDGNGVVNFTQQKPKGVYAEPIRMTKSGKNAPVAVSAPAKQPTDGPHLSKEQQAMLDQLRAAETARQAEVEKIRVANCDKSQRVLSRLTQKARIRVRSDDGTERAMDEDERQRRISEAQQGVATNCTG